MPEEKKSNTMPIIIGIVVIIALIVGAYFVFGQGTDDAMVEGDQAAAVEGANDEAMEDGDAMEEKDGDAMEAGAEVDVMVE